MAMTFANHPDDSKNPTIYNICWFPGLLGQMTCCSSDVPSIISFIVSYRLRALKTVYFHFCNFTKKLIERVFTKNFARFYEK